MDLWAVLEIAGWVVYGALTVLVLVLMVKDNLQEENPSWSILLVVPLFSGIAFISLLTALVMGGIVLYCIGFAVYKPIDLIWEREGECDLVVVVEEHQYDVTTLRFTDPDKTTRIELERYHDSPSLEDDPIPFANLIHGGDTTFILLDQPNISVREEVIRMFDSEAGETTDFRLSDSHVETHFVEAKYDYPKKNKWECRLKHGKIG